MALVGGIQDDYVLHYTSSGLEETHISVEKQ